MDRDLEVGERLRARLRLHPYLCREDLEIDVRDGVVRLSGTTTTRLAKMAAWDSAWSIPNVRDVEIDVRIIGTRHPASNS